MRLRDLDAYFVRYETRIDTWHRVIGDPATWKSGDPVETVTGPREFTVRVETLAEAQGIWFQCPKCVAADGHYLDVSFEGRGVKDAQGSHGKDGSPTRWKVSGTNLDDLTTQPSILIEYPCGWHGYITNGDAA